MAAAIAALGTKYYTAKKLITKLDDALSFASELIGELSGLVSQINIALEDDTLSKEELTAIGTELNDVIDKLKAAVKLVKNNDGPE